MKPSTPSTEQIRQSLVEQIAAITTMQPGTLAEEYREHPDTDGKGVVRRGPYFKHQCWQDGRNLSRRVPASQAAQLRQDIENAKLFGHLTAQLAQLNIQHTLALRAAEASNLAEVRDAKKNSTRKPASKGSAKPKPSSRKPRRA
jgi:hypothetical protein